MSKKVYVIVLNWNGKDDTLNCLHSLHASRVSKGEMKVLVVDNASTDDSIEAIKRQYPFLEVIQNETNLGFAAGNNIGIDYVFKKGADGVLLLNNDTQVDQNFFGELVGFAFSSPRIGIVGPILKFKKGFEIFYDLGGQVTFYGRAEHHNSGLLLLKEPKRVNYVSGAAMLIKKEVFEEIGKLDEKYFFGWEDVDFCFKAQKAGFETWLVPQSVIEHKISGTIKGGSLEKIYYNLRNNLLFIKSHTIREILPFSYLYVFVLSLKICFNNSKYVKVVIRAWQDFLKSKFGKLEGYL